MRVNRRAAEHLPPPMRSGAPDRGPDV